MSTSTRSMTGAQALLEVLKAEGVEYVFGLPGLHNLHIYDALYHSPEVRHIPVRHEQAAANMAAGYAQLTGKIGVCTATAGPGATNLATGIAEAFMGALPVIAITGRGDTRTTYRGAGQEIAQDKLFAPITKWAVRVDRADLLVEALRRAFTIAPSGKPGPVLIDIPLDLQGQMVEFGGYQPVGRPSTVRAPAKVIAEVADRLRASKRPIIVAGGGAVASDAQDALVRLAEAGAIPVLTTLSGRGSFPDNHVLAAGGLGLHHNFVSKEQLVTADFVLGLGCRFEEMETNWQPGFLPSPDACYVQVDIDPTEIGKSLVPAIGVVSDARLMVEDLLSALDWSVDSDRTAKLSSLPRIAELIRNKEELERRIAPLAASDERPLNPVRIFREAREVFGESATGAIDIGFAAQGFGGAYPYFKVNGPRSLIVCTSFYAMGFASSALPVAKLVHPNRPAIGFCGDGTFQMIMNVLPVAAELGLAVTWCILNNHSFGSIRRCQEGLFDGRYIATAFAVTPDFTKIAEACGCHGDKVERAEDIKPALERALAANAQGVPAVIDFFVSDERPEATHSF